MRLFYIKNGRIYKAHVLNFDLLGDIIVTKQTDFFQYIKEK